MCFSLWVTPSPSYTDQPHPLKTQTTNDRGFKCNSFNFWSLLWLWQFWRFFMTWRLFPWLPEMAFRGSDFLLLFGFGGITKHGAMPLKADLWCNISIYICRKFKMLMGCIMVLVFVCPSFLRVTHVLWGFRSGSLGFQQELTTFWYRWVVERHKIWTRISLGGVLKSGPSHKLDSHDCFFWFFWGLKYDGCDFDVFWNAINY